MASGSVRLVISPAQLQKAEEIVDSFFAAQDEAHNTVEILPDTPCIWVYEKDSFDSEEAVLLLQKLIDELDTAPQLSFVAVENRDIELPGSWYAEVILLQRGKAPVVFDDTDLVRQYFFKQAGH